MKRRSAVLLTACFVLEGVAQAADCSPYTLISWRGALDDVDREFAAQSYDQARQGVEAMHTSLPCLVDVAPPSLLARFGRQEAFLAFLDQDEDTATHWGLMSRLAGPQLPWPAEVTRDAPFRILLDGADLPPVGGSEKMGLVVDKGGALLMNGAPLLVPEAYAEVPGFA